MTVLRGPSGRSTPDLPPCASSTTIPRRVPQVVFDGRSEHYRGAVGLARLILSGVSFDLGAGEVAASAFLIDMNKVFEDFVVVALRDALRVSDRVLV